MSNINFPDTPQTNDTVGFGTNMWRFDGQKWELVLYKTPKYGIIDGANADKKNVLINGGAPSSNFTGTEPIDSGSIA